MIRSLIFILLFTCTNFSNAQVVTPEYILGSLPEQTPRYLPVNNDSVLSLATGYNNFSINEPELMNEIISGKIKRVDLVYTANKNYPGFAQTELNTKRLHELFEKYPRLFDNNLVEWHLLEQNGYNTQKEAESYFHGFVFYFSNSGKANNKLTTEEEIAILEELLKKSFPAITEEAPDSSFELAEVTVIEGEKRCYLPRSKHKMAKGITYKRRSIWRRKRCTDTDDIVEYDTVWKKGKPDRVVARYYNPPFSDSVVTTVMRRNIHLDTSATLLVEDVTGSMYPYIYQAFDWRRKYHSQITKYTFFNDGDNTPHHAKVIGATGGIYELESNAISKIEAHVQMVMRKGNGGDGPENNIEATLYALKQFPDSDSLIMIVDNWAPVKDIILLTELVEKRKPVHVILCGYRGAINSDYIKIAIETKGTIHTIEEDISFAKPIKDGAILLLGAQKFEYKKGKLVLVR